MIGLELLDVVKVKQPDLSVLMITIYGDTGPKTDAKQGNDPVAFKAR
jgi:hypothetical protein